MSNSQPEEAWHVGHVKFFDQQKGFGFLKDYVVGEDIYVHQSDLASELITSDDVVAFRVAPSQRKRGSSKAVGVTLLEEHEDQERLSEQFGRQIASRSLHFGRVKFFDSVKGFGFIKDWVAEQDVYVNEQNVISSRIGDGHHVVFEVQPSTSKKGAEEAADVVRLEEYAGAGQILLDHVGTARGEVEKLMIRRMDDSALQSLAEQQVEKHGTLDSEEACRKIVELHEQIGKNEVAGDEARNAAGERFKQVAVRHASARGRVHFWLEEWCDSPPLDDIAAAMAAASRDISQYRMLSAVDADERSHLLAAAVREAARSAEEASPLQRVKVVLETGLDWLDDEFPSHQWKDRSRSDREALIASDDGGEEAFYAAAVETVQSACSDEIQLALFFEGFVSTYPAAHVKETLLELTHEQLGRVFAHGSTEAHLTEELLRGRAAHVQTRGGDAQMKEAKWLFKRADAHLSEEATQAVRERVSEELPPEARLTLFFEGFAPTYPLEHVREVAPGLSYEQLKKVLAHPDTNFDFAEELLGSRLAAKRDDLTNLHRWVGEAKRLLEAADAHASGGAALREYVLSETPDEARLTLFLKGRIETFPREHVRRSAKKMNRHRLEQVVAHEATSSALAYDALRDHLKHAVEADDPVGCAKWVLRVAAEHLTDEDRKALRQAVLDLLLPQDQLVLWEEGHIEEVPTAHVRQQLANGEGRVFGNGPQWVQDERIPPDVFATLVIDSLASLPTVEQHEDYARLEKRLTLLGEAVPEALVRAKEEARDKQRDFVRLFLWLNSYGEAFDFAAFRSLLVYLAPEDQVTFLQKLFHLHRQGEFVLTAGKLDRLTRVDLDIFSIAEAQNVEETLDLSVEIVIQVVRSVQQSGTFPRQNDLLKVVYYGMSGRKRMSVETLFDECAGRMEAEWNWQPQWGTVTKMQDGRRSHFVIEFEYDAGLVEAVKQLPGRRYDPDGQCWTVPARHEEAVTAFAAKHRFFIRLPDEHHYTNNTHFCTMQREGKPPGVRFCEGRKAKDTDDFVGSDFWWCRGDKCYENAAPDALRDDWRQYTLRDILQIFPGRHFEERKWADADKLPTEVIPEGEYFNFVALINRFNQLIEHLHCRACDQLLYPVEVSNFAHYRVTRFHCTDASCAEHGNEVYLHHCVNGKCKRIIDSRDTEQCPEGWWICTSRDCGSCCSHKANRRRLEYMRETGGYISQSLREAVADKTGHRERALHYCYSCGAKMDEYEREKFRCASCGIEYDTEGNNFSRPGRNESRSNSGGSSDRREPPGTDFSSHVF